MPGKHEITTMRQPKDTVGTKKGGVPLSIQTGNGIPSQFDSSTINS